jgi:hypothetical protein
MTLSLLAACAALAVFRLQRPGLARSAGMICVVLLFAVAAAALALYATATLPALGRIPASAVAVLAAMLVTLTARRIAAVPVLSEAPGAMWFSLLLAVLAAVGFIVAWLSGADDALISLPATIGIGLGLLLARVLRASRPSDVAAAKHGGRKSRALPAASQAVMQFFDERLPRFRDRLLEGLVSLWHGEIWVSRVARLEALLGRWPTTALGVLFVAIAVGLLLLG